MELARIGTFVITVGDLSTRINRMSKYVRSRYRALDKKRSLLESMVEFEVLAREAGRRGFGRHPDTVRMLRQTVVEARVPRPRLAGVSEARRERLLRLLRKRRRKALEQYQQSLRARARVTIHEDRLARVTIDVTLRRSRF